MNTLTAMPSSAALTGSPSLITAARELQAVPGAERSGGSYYNEHDAYAAAWLRRLIAMGLIAPGVVDERSITEIKPHEITGYTQCHFFAGIGGWPLALRLAGWADDEPAWTGSCPCQPFSDAGEGGGIEDERHLWPSWFSLIRECGPAILFGEQVATQAALAWLDIVFADLEGADYACAAADLCAASVGAPQRRQRLWWMADSNDSRWERAERQRQSHQAREKRAAACRESLRSNRGPWPPGPRALDSIPLLANGLPGTMGGCKGYGNAIVPEVAAEFVMASIEAVSSVRWAAGAGRGAAKRCPRNGASTGNTRLEPKIENLKRQAKFGWHACPRCGGQAHAVICWSCKQDLPKFLRRLETLTTEGEDRRDVDEQVLAWAITKRRAA